MKEGSFFGNLKINSRFTLVILAFTFVPIGVMAGVLFRNLETDAIKESYNYMEAKVTRDYAMISTNIESINMSTRFFLSDEGLSDILTMAYDGQTMDTRQIIDFYNTQVADLERLVNNNPVLYAVRVYGVNDNVQEMMPVLYNNTRMKKLSWYDDVKEGWHFGYHDTLFSSLTTDQGTELAGLCSQVTDYDRGVIGYVEAAMPLKTMFPGVYEGDDTLYSFFVSSSGQVLFGSTKDNTESLEASTGYSKEPDFGDGLDDSTYYRSDKVDESLIIDAFTTDLGELDRQIIYKKISGRYLTIARYPIRSLDGVMYSVQDITSQVWAVYHRRNIFVFIMTIVLFVTAGLIYRIVRRFQKEVLSKSSELRSLQNQINAHFIYNVLESIKMMAEIDEKYEISDAITSLGKLMRYSIKQGFGNVHLSDELEYIKNYVLLINLRYDFEVILSLNVPGDLLSQEIPKMSLQPIVENAVLHGIEPVAADTTIYIKAWKDDDRFRIEITDSGKGMDEGELQNLLKRIHGEIEESGGRGNGIGLKNVEDRIKLTFGSEYGLEVYSKPLKYTKVSIVLPRRDLEKK